MPCTANQRLQSNAPPNLGDMDMSQMDEMLKTLMAGMGESNDGDAAGGNVWILEFYRD